MALGIESKASEINGVTDDIKEKFPECMEHTMVFLQAPGTFVPDTVITFSPSGNSATVVLGGDTEPWVFVKDVTPNSPPITQGDVISGVGSGVVVNAESIEEVIDDCILLKVFNILALSMDKLRAMFADMFSGMKSYSAPCGANKLLEGTQVGDAQGAHKKLVDKLQSGGALNDIHDKLQSAYLEADDCYSLYQKLAETCSALDGVMALLQQVLDALKKFEELLDKMLAVLGMLSAILSCGEELLDATNTNMPWVGELNADMGKTIDAANEAKAATDSPQAASAYAKEKAVQDMNFDLDLVDRKNEMLNLGELF